MHTLFHRPLTYLVSLAAFGLFNGGAGAATIAVTNTHETLAGSLRQAIQDANAGDNIVFRIPVTDPGYSSASGLTTIAYTGPSGSDPDSALVIAKDLTIDGAGAKIVISRSSVSGTPQFRLFNVTAGNVTIANLTIYNGYVGAINGGGLLNTGQLTVRGCAFGNNFSGNGGGGLHNLAAGTAAINNCTFYGNTTANAGRAIQNAGALRLTNSTVSQNPSTYPNNAAIYGGGTFRIGNTIVAGNPPSGAYTDSFGSFISEGYNFIGDPYGGGGSASSGFGLSGSHDQLGTHASPANPQLGGITFGVGPTPYFQPQPGSPVIDQGNRGLDANGQPVNVDQRGLARPANQPFIADSGDGSDIGAIELGLPQPGPTYTVTTTGEHDDGSCSTDDCTLLEALNAANANADANTINFAPGVTGTIFNSIATNGLLITNPLTINGPGARLLTLAAGAVKIRLFNITSSAGNVQISGLTMANGVANSGDGLGGAIRNAANLTLTDCSLTSNLSTSHGGAIYHDGSSHTANLSLANCTLSGNSANASGGTIFIGAYGGHTTVNLTNCTIDNNSASQYGGAIYNDGTSNGNAALIVTNCTFNQNSAPNTGGIVTDGSNPGSTGIATVTLRNTILRSGSSGINLTSDGGTITSQGNNISNDGAGGPAGTAPGGFLNASGDMRNTDPQLALLANNGGPTNTIALLAGSPAINAGNDANAPVTDQRGFARNGVSDIGAFDLNAPPPPVQLANVVSRKYHGSVGAFDLNLALAGTPTVESRSGGAASDYLLILTFTNPLGSVGGVTVSAGSGSVSAANYGSSAQQYVVTLTGVTNAQNISLSLTNVTDSLGHRSSATTASMGLLLGDVNGDGAVNSADATVTRNGSGQATAAANFRADVNADGTINSADSTIVRNNSGRALPLQAGPVPVAGDSLISSSMPTP